MTTGAQVEQSLKHILEERANVLARETGCIERQRKFSGADLLQTLVFGWLSHPDASLETLISLATSRQVYVTDTALHNRFTKSCAHFLHAVFEEMAIKKEVFAKLDTVCKPGAIFASNTSYLNINELSQSTRRPQRTTGPRRR